MVSEKIVCSKKRDKKKVERNVPFSDFSFREIDTVLLRVGNEMEVKLMDEKKTERKRKIIIWK